MITKQLGQGGGVDLCIEQTKTYLRSSPLGFFSSSLAASRAVSQEQHAELSSPFASVCGVKRQAAYSFRPRLPSTSGTAADTAAYFADQDSRCWARR